jgi:hypothetical protein
MCQLHLDHKYDVSEIIRVWKENMPKSLKAWDDGINGELVCHLLFGVEKHHRYQAKKNQLWERNLYFRCGNSNGKTKPHNKLTTYCHKSKFHWEYQLKSSDLSEYMT